MRPISAYRCRRNPPPRAEQRVTAICTSPSLGNVARPGAFSGAGTDGTQNRRGGMRRVGILLLHDNARPHAVLLTQQLLQRFYGSWKVFDPPTCNPDLASSDYHLSQHL
ncbi:hypothetical protein AVEN_71984-1 [Araneus ventricosus]|uniref:Histone-lysine N-methyltransferase SETMAR n=1 Tax=Araneus ventricosus TaxID=182803 RepID=A0A4Y2DD86_ARAVE|nr:hypothetical protein AVEN_71984-1 [Araneus ventricosus]